LPERKRQEDERQPLLTELKKANDAKEKMCGLGTILRDAIETVRPGAELKDIRIDEDYEGRLTTAA
jgi:hypothetical protein